MFRVILLNCEGFFSYLKMKTSNQESKIIFHGSNRLRRLNGLRNASPALDLLDSSLFLIFSFYSTSPFMSVP